MDRRIFFVEPVHFASDVLDSNPLASLFLVILGNASFRFASSIVFIGSLQRLLQVYKVSNIMLGVGTVHRMHADTIECETAEGVWGCDSARRFLHHLLLSSNVVPRVYGEVVIVLYLILNKEKLVLIYLKYSAEFIVFTSPVILKISDFR
jgi:hypothetical protein